MYIVRKHGQRASVVMGPLTCGVKGTLSCRKTQKFTQIHVKGPKNSQSCLMLQLHCFCNCFY